VTSPGSLTAGIRACRVERAAGTAFRHASSTRPTVVANSNRDYLRYDTALAAGWPKQYAAPTFKRGYT